MTDVDLDALASRALDLIGGRAEATVTVRNVHEGLTRFANSFIHQNVGDEHVALTLEVAAAGRTASSTTTDVSDSGVRRIVESTLQAASVQPVDEDWPGLAPPAPLVGDPSVHFDQATAEAGPRARADVVAAFVAAGDGLEAAATSATVDGIHRLGRSDGCGATLSTRLADIDGRVAGAEAADAARRGADAIELAPGRYEVVLEPRCVAYMLDFFTVYAFNARAVQEGRSFAAIGEEQLD
jgi:predicted Zn-dependent protease